MRTTKLELAQALQARNTELEAARLRIAELEGDVAALTSQLGRERADNEKLREGIDGLQAHVGIADHTIGQLEAKLEAAAAPAPQRVKAVYVRPERQPTPEQLAYRAALAQAKEFAMRTGRSVKVVRPEGF